MKKVIIFGFIICLVFVLAQCTKDKTPTPDTYNPTPYNLQSPPGFPPMPTNPLNPLTKEGVALGRFLFYDPILSADSTIACASCHKQEAAFTDPNKANSTGIGGAIVPRNAMPLFNLAWYSSYFWDGKVASIEDQVFFPVRSHIEMNLQWPQAVSRLQHNPMYAKKFYEAFGTYNFDSTHVAYAIAQFERTLLSYNSKFDRVKRNKDFFNDDELEGYLLISDFFGGDCLHCHPVDNSMLITSLDLRNNGLDSALIYTDYTDKGLGGVTHNPNDYGLFKVPSLRNIALTAPYMHDGRFNTLDEVLDFYSTGVHNSYNTDPKMEYAHQKGVQLTADEKLKLKAFFMTLSDTVFITNPDYSNPF